MRSKLARAFLLFAFFFSCSAASVLPSHAQEPGAVAGTLVDSETGEPLISANVQIAGTSTGAATDLKGRYRIEGLEPGTYDLVFSYLGYQRKTVTGVAVSTGETTTLDVQLAPQHVDLEEVTVEARMIRDSEAALLKDRQKAAALSDAVSAETMSQAGAGTAADAMEKVTGASVVGGKYVHVRGLGGRYMNTELNGATLPSADPDRNAVQFDLFPADLLSNVVTTKTFTPDQPGTFTGGNVNINTKAYPEALSISFSASTKYNTQLGYGDDMLLYQGGSAGRFGMNGKAHEMPDVLREILDDPEAELPTRSEARRDPGKADTLNRVSKAFDPVMGPSRVSAPFNQSYSLSLGNQISVLGRPLGLVGSLSYSREASGYADGVEAQYELPGDAVKNESLFANSILSPEVDTVNGFPVNGFSARGTDEVLWGGLMTASYKLHPEHEVAFTYMRNQNATSSARHGVGRLPRDLGSEDVWEIRKLAYVERRLSSYQAKGQHVLPAGVQLSWNSTVSRTRQDEPDHRYFYNDFSIFERGGRVDTFYNIRPANYTLPTRYFRKLEEESWVSELEAAIPVFRWKGRTAELKVGGSYTDKGRVFREERFTFHPQLGDSLRAVNGDPTAFYAPRHVGVIGTTGTAANPRFEIGNYISRPGNASDYEADQEIAAAFGMVDVPLTGRLRVVGGVRFEATRMDVRNLEREARDSTARGALHTNDWLPSLNLTYQFTESVNLRAAYGRTLARPTFREFAPYSSFEYPNRTYIGNPELERTLVDNIDLRGEWFPRPGEIVAVSGFYKAFAQPIENVILNTNYEVKPQNVDFARVYGIELEARKRLDPISPLLQHVTAGANLTLNRSVVALDSLEYQRTLEWDPNAPDTRPMEGQSPYVINANLSYDNPNSGTSISAYYNVFGPRLHEVALRGTPDIYEQPRHVLDVTARQHLGGGLSVKASAKNLLDDPYRLTHTFKHREFVARQYRKGRTFSLGFSYEL